MYESNETFRITTSHRCTWVHDIATDCSFTMPSATSSLATLRKASRHELWRVGCSNKLSKHTTISCTGFLIPFSTSDLSVEDCRDAMLQFVAENCCYGAGTAKEMQITDTRSSKALHVSNIEELEYAIIDFRTSIFVSRTINSTSWRLTARRGRRRTYTSRTEDSRFLVRTPEFRPDRG